VRQHHVGEVLGMQPLALQATLHVGEGDHHRVDVTGVDPAAQVLQREHPAVAL